MIPNTATSLWFSVSRTFTITSPRSIDAIRAESSPVRCWRNVASLTGGCCACSGTPTAALQPASTTQPSSLIPPLERTCTTCPPLPPHSDLVRRTRRHAVPVTYSSRYIWIGSQKYTTRPVPLLPAAYLMPHSADGFPGGLPSPDRTRTRPTC